MNAKSTKPATSKVESVQGDFPSSSVMGAFKQVSTRFDIASLTGSADNKLEPENRSLLELSRLMASRNGDTQTVRNPRKRRFDIASLTGTSTDDDSRSPGSPELDVVALDSCSSTDSTTGKRTCKATLGEGPQHNEDPSEPKNFSIPRGNTYDHGSAFRKIDKQASITLRGNSEENERQSPSHAPQLNILNSEPPRLTSSSVNSPVMSLSPHSLFSSQTDMPLATKFPFQDDAFNYIKMPSQIKSPNLVNSGEDSRMMHQSRTAVLSPHSAKSQTTVPPPPPPPPPTIDSFTTKSYQHPLLSFLPPSLAALTFPTQNWCAKCNATFRMTSDLVYHMRSHHKRPGDTTSKKREEKLRCDICKESFRERHHLTRHMTSHQ